MRLLALSWLCWGFSALASAQLSVQLTASADSPSVGTPVTFAAAASDSNPGSLDYQFAISYNNEPFQIIIDFNSYSSITWTPSAREGLYTMQVTARNKTAGDSAISQVQLNVESLVTGNQPVVTATANPLVALYSAPPCPVGVSIAVAFGTGTAMSQTDQRPCNGSTSTNFYIAGMLANTTYQMHTIFSTNPRRSSFRPGFTVKSVDLKSDSRSASPEAINSLAAANAVLQFTTGAIPTSLSFPSITIPVPANAQASTDQGILLTDSTSQFSAQANTFYFPTATDLNGNVLWYYSALGTLAESQDYFIRPIPGGTILLIAADPSTVLTVGQILREIDLAGNTIRETNVNRVNEQLALLGMQGVIDFDHDAIRLPNGHTIVICAQERMYPAGTQGSAAPVDIVGDAIVDLDSNLQVTWAWSGYDHLDINRAAVLGEVCKQGQSGCPPVTLAPTSNDWLHGNSLNYNPITGDLYFSLRHQDWVARIDYGFGAGSGQIIWELGKDGSFNYVSSDPYPWQSHQHDVEFELQGDTILSLFDNGNTRAALNPTLTENSRGMVLQIDESAMTATPILLQDLGVQSVAVGSAQRLDNGDYHFDAGLVYVGPAQVSYLSEYSLSGQQNFLLQSHDFSYRSYRMVSLYETDSSGN